MSSLYDRTKVKYLVVHYLGDGLGPCKTKEELLKRANPYGYQYPEYDNAILEDGTILTAADGMRPLTVIGAHTISDRPNMMWGPNWWNCNAASIVLGWGLEESSSNPMPATMLQALNRFVGEWIGERGGTVGTTVLPHNVVTQTDCPGFNFKEVVGMINKDVPVVVWFGRDDLEGALQLTRKVNGVMVERAYFNNWNAADKASNTVYIVGGEPIQGSNYVNLAGSNWKETVGMVLNRL